MVTHAHNSDYVIVSMVTAVILHFDWSDFSFHFQNRTKYQNDLYFLMNLTVATKYVYCVYFKSYFAEYFWNFMLAGTILLSCH